MRALGCFLFGHKWSYTVKQPLTRQEYHDFALPLPDGIINGARSWLETVEVGACLRCGAPNPAYREDGPAVEA